MESASNRVFGIFLFHQQGNSRYYNQHKCQLQASLYSPLSINSGETEVNGNTGFTFVKNLTYKGVTGTSTITNSYYTRTLGTAQGKLAHTITAGENVTLAPKGKATAYSVSGITAYADNDGLKYGDKLYAGNKDRVALTLGYTGKAYFDKTNTLAPLGDVAIDSKFAKHTSTLPENLYDGATLSPKSKTTLSLYFTAENELSFTCIEEPVEGQPEKVMTVETVKTETGYIARIRDIAASKLQKNYIVTVKNGETVIGTVTYSPMNYCCKALNNGTTDTRLQNVVKALYWYSEAANEYFGDYSEV